MVIATSVVGKVPALRLGLSSGLIELWVPIVGLRFVEMVELYR